MNAQDLPDTLSFLTNRSSYAAMRDCIRKKDVEGFKRVFDQIRKQTPLDDNTHQDLLQLATNHGSLACFQELQPYVAEPTVYSEALNTAARRGHLDLVEYIEPLMDEYSKEEALWMAVLYDQRGVVDFLLPLCNPKNQSSKFLGAAVFQGHQELVELLYPLSTPKDALRYLKRKTPDQPEKWEMLEQRILREQLKAVTSQNRPSKRSKI